MIRRFALSLLLLSASAAAQNIPIAGSEGLWVVDSEKRAAHAKVAPHLGREGLWLRANAHVFQPDLDFENGVIEFDVAPLPGCNFVALMFRRESFQEHENIYIRPFKSGSFESVQYAPRLHAMSTWQLYPEFQTAVDLPTNEWTHFRVEVRGSRLRIQVGDSEILVERLRGEAASGSIGFWARINDDPSRWAAVVSNIVIRPESSESTVPGRTPPPSGTLARWEVANQVFPHAESWTEPPSASAWSPAEAEESGLVNLTRALGRRKPGDTAFARTTIHSENARTALLDLGYSDEVWVFLNGRLLYSGVNAWESRHPGFLSYVLFGAEKVALPLQAGENEIVLLVSDDQRFGWGFKARLLPPLGR